MSDPNPILTDKELRELFKSLLMEEKGDSALTENLIDMEATLAFTTIPTLLPPVHKEKELLKKLHTQYGYKAIAKWLYILVGSTVAVATALILSKTPEPVVQKEITPQQVDTTVPATDIPENTPAVPLPAETPVKKNTLVPPVSAPAPAPAPEANSGGILAEGERKYIDTSFSDITRLEVRGAFFNVNVKSTQADQLGVTGYIYNKAKGIITAQQDYRIRYEQENHILRVIVESTGSRVADKTTSDTEAELNFRLPAGADLGVDNPTGNITAEGLTGKKCELNTNSGNIRAWNIGKAGTMKNNDQSQGSIVLTTGAGNITAGECEGNLSLRTKQGDHTLSNITGNLDISTQTGNITGKKILVTGNASLSTDLGNIKLNLANTHNDISFDLQTKLGNISIDKSYGVETGGDPHIKINRGKILVKAFTRTGNQVFE